ncbi:RraA family protein [Jannaschia rubra]|uniref:Putative 4-hydroxy-4-methyl-2-oxoglutarate aldolase n=1 Tax=Jannaschia rubra TaxID=282197 RepID=A0A0M6XMJ8_9RHOB|nr:RraA family protein [Jannaschia rubra]CTQ31882.1 bifunctional hexulose-6-phosphate synthase/ribonuclease regulator [Jannaschia rubra]SFG77968.1 Regulator of RNase E activity RraA [Jannaschia rubra]
MTEPEIWTALRRVDTPTVCNAIEVIEGRRGFSGFTPHALIPSHPDAPAMAGRARTSRIRSAAPDPAPKDEVRARRMEYFRHMHSAPAPSIAVVEDMDGDDAIGAWWGEVHARIHKAFGLAGAITNGLIRDLGDLPADFPILGGAVGPSHGFVHVVDSGTPVTIGGLRIADGDALHADRHGVVAIPEDYLADLPAAIDRLARIEGTVLDHVTDGLDFETFEKLWQDFENARV